MIKRVALFVLTNILILVMVSVVLSLLGVGGYITETGLDYYSLAIFCLVWGFAGAFISLAISRFMAKMMMQVAVIKPNSASEYQWLVQVVHNLARRANLPAMPEVGVYQSPEMNAFATGPTKSRSLVAVSSGLAQRMSRDEIEGVLAHEIAHIQNGDMVTMTLLQGVINAFVMFFARIAAFAASRAVDEKYSYIVHIAVVILAQILLGLLGMIVLSAFSRQREFRADAGGAKLGGQQNMISALAALEKNISRSRGQSDMPDSLAAFGISGKPSRFAMLFSTHPPLSERIKRLQGL